MEDTCGQCLKERLRKRTEKAPDHLRIRHCYLIKQTICLLTALKNNLSKKYMSHE